MPAPVAGDVGPGELLPPERARTSLQLFAVCAALSALALKQAPARMVGDTKLDLAVDPVRLLSRSLHLWDPSRDFGVLQNQNYGYLFPMGPFFVMGRALGLPAWAVQRLWWAALLCLAFLGLVKLAEALGIGTAGSRLLAGLAFALSPRMLSTIGPISVESLPYCLAPWVVLPLVRVSHRGGSARRAAARSAVAVLCMGAVNAVAVLAALPPAVLWLLTRERGKRRRQLLGWWTGCVLLAVLWWLVPLLLLGRFSPPFLDYIETAGTTTSVTSLIEALRGTSDWVAYLTGPGGPTWPAGFALVSVPLVIAYTVFVLTAGIGGVLRRDLPERLWLTSCLLLGLAAITAGHLGSLVGFGAAFLHAQLDASLAPLRNLHKFDVVVRLPVALGFAHLAGRLLTSAAVAASRSQRVVVQVAATSVVLGAALPALSVGLAPQAPFVEVPSYWRQTADWLAQHRDAGRALLLPGSSFPDYVWGNSNDEPLQPLARSDWAVRSAIPLVPPRTIRALDAIERRVAAGLPAPGLAGDLARMGVAFVVVRNDLAYGKAGSTRPLLVHEALAGMTRVSSFGPRIGGGIHGAYVDEGIEVAYPAVEIFAVPKPEQTGHDALPQTADGQVALQSASDAAVVVGGPEAVLGLEDRHLLPGRAAVLAQDAGGMPALTGPVILTDSLQRREVAFGRLADNRSPTLSLGEGYRLDAPAHDYLAPGDARLQTVARILGARSVGASSSASDANAFGGAHPDAAPFAAVDGDPSTSWRSDPGKGLYGASWRIAFGSARSVRGVVVRLGGSPHGWPRLIRVTGRDEGRLLPVPPSGRVSVDLPSRSDYLQVTAAGGPAGGLGSFDVAEVSVPGLTVTRALELPPVDRADVIALETAGNGRPACFPLGATLPCSSALARPGDETSGLHRIIQLRQAEVFRVVQATAVPVGGPALDALVDPDRTVVVTASSSATSDPAGRPAAAFDGDPKTGWRAAPGDIAPSLTLNWRVPQRVSQLRLVVDPTLAASHPGKLTVVADGTPVLVGGTPRPDGTVVLPVPVRVRQLRLTFVVAAVAPTVDPVNGSVHPLPVGVSEIVVPTAASAAVPPAEITMPCGSGPDVHVGPAVLRTGLRASRADLLGRRPVALTLCQPGATVPVGIGTEITALTTSALQPVALTLISPMARLGPVSPPPVRAVGWTQSRREVALPARAGLTLLEVHENTNPGWQASLAGKQLRRVTLDGWQQGWVVPAGAAATVRLTYAPDHVYRSALVIGGLLALGLCLLGLLPGTRSCSAAALGTARTRWWHAATLAGILLLVGGPLAVLMCPCAWAARQLAPRSTTAVALGALLSAGALLVLRPWPSADYLGRGPWTQALCLTTLVIVWSAVLPSLGRARAWSLHAMTGRSTSR